MIDYNNRNDRARRNSYTNSSHIHKKKNKAKSFGSQEIKLDDIVFAPEGYEAPFFTLYFISIPYIVGAIFLFLFVAQADFDSFMMLNMTSFFIVWAIGYEIVGTIALLWIFILFLMYDDTN